MLNSTHGHEHGHGHHDHHDHHDHHGGGPNLQFTRFDKPFKSRDEAIRKLDSITRSYAETVALKYFNAAETECILLALYRSTRRGDYDILYDSDAEAIGVSVSKIYKITKQNGDESDETSIKRALLGETPSEKDYVCITSADGTGVTSYVYSEGSWYCLGKGSTATEMAETIVDGNTLTFDEATGTIQISTIYGGTF